MADVSEVKLLHLVDRAERGSLLAEEATELRDGIRHLATAHRARGGQLAKDRSRHAADIADLATALHDAQAALPADSPLKLCAACDHTRADKHWNGIGRCTVTGCGCLGFAAN